MDSQPTASPTNSQSTPISPMPTAQIPSHQSQKKMVLLGIVAVIGLLGLLAGAYTLGTKNTLSSQVAEKASVTATPTETPNPTSEALRASDTAGNKDKEKDATSIRPISYKLSSGLENYISATGYSAQLPEGFVSAQTPTEQKAPGNSCGSIFTNNAGGNLSFGVHPYNGGSLKQFLGEEPSYTYKYEDVLIQGTKSLLKEKGPAGESGSSTTFVIPIGENALIGVFTNRGIDDPQFTSLLSSIAFPIPLDTSKCGM